MEKKKEETKGINEEMVKTLRGEFEDVVDVAMKEHIGKALDTEVADKVGSMVKRMRVDQGFFGKDASGLDDETKLEFFNNMKSVLRGDIQKDVHNSQIDDLGGYLVPKEVFAGIMRIAASVGIVARDAMHFSMTSDRLEVPNYTGGTLLGEYQGIDQEASETTVRIGDSVIQTQNWIVLFRVGNTLMQDANVNIADWLLGLVAEGLAARLDKEGFVGGSFSGSPFTGLLESDDTTSYTMPATKVDFADFTADEASEVIGNMSETILGECAFYFHRTVWAQIRKQKTANGMYTVGQNNSMIAANFKKEGIMPAGVLWDFPVYTSDALPSINDSAVSTNFGLFASMKKALYVGDRQSLTIAKNEGATVNGTNVFAANQLAIRATHRHGVVVGLPNAAVKIATAAA